MAEKMQLHKGQRSKAFLKLGVSAPSGGGKTLGALMIAFGLMKEQYPNLPDAQLWEKIAIVDTENGSGELYVGSEFGNLKIGEYNAITLRPPFEADKYTQALELCQEAGIEVVVIDSTTHLWSGEGGMLEQQSAAAKRSGNSYTAWRDVTPQHNRFVNAMLQMPLHIIATMRSKQEYVQQKDEKSGRTTVQKLGMEPEQRKGMEYEFTVFFEISADHNAFGSKDRTSMFDQRTFKITPEIGKQLMQWLNSGVETAQEVIATSHKADPVQAEREIKEDIIAICKRLGGSKNETLMAIIKEYDPNGNPNSIKDAEKLDSLYADLKNFESNQTQN